jgi:hypothetical protein
MTTRFIRHSFQFRHSDFVIVSPGIWRTPPT